MYKLDLEFLLTTQLHISARSQIYHLGFKSQLFPLIRKHVQYTYELSMHTRTHMLQKLTIKRF